MILRGNSETVIRHPETHYRDTKDPKGSDNPLLKDKDDPQDPRWDSDLTPWHKIKDM